ncbi:hypothetical protein Tsp_11151 [Trichinella spiralis]|uniref:hypothetical protein n=1 Tax=Trichinella spiralis TaxID=6334 RepID=UPI0001EFEC9A|nr:hypothetical protein Tsp_11151 [Trichinella spiralis]
MHTNTALAAGLQLPYYCCCSDRLGLVGRYQTHGLSTSVDPKVGCKFVETTNLQRDDDYSPDKIRQQIKITGAVIDFYCWLSFQYAVQVGQEIFNIVQVSVDQSHEMKISRVAHMFTHD